MLAPQYQFSSSRWHISISFRHPNILTHLCEDISISVVLSVPVHRYLFLFPCLHIDSTRHLLLGTSIAVSSFWARSTLVVRFSGHISFSFHKISGTRISFVTFHLDTHPLVRSGRPCSLTSIVSAHLSRHYLALLLLIFIRDQLSQLSLIGTFCGCLASVACWIFAPLSVQVIVLVPSFTTFHFCLYHTTTLALQL